MAKKTEKMMLAEAKARCEAAGGGWDGNSVHPTDLGDIVDHTPKSTRWTATIRRFNRRGNIVAFHKEWGASESQALRRLVVAVEAIAAAEGKAK